MAIVDVLAIIVLVFFLFLAVALVGSRQHRRDVSGNNPVPKIVNTARYLASVAFWIVSIWNGILVILWNISFFSNFVPRFVDIVLGFILLEALPIIFIVCWVLYGFGSVSPLLAYFFTCIIAMYLGYFLWPKRRDEEE